MPLFRRKSTDLVADAVDETAVDPTAPSDEPTAPVAPGFTPGKGRPTPKRTTANRRPAEPPPANRREAYRRSREHQRATRAEAAEGMRRGDEQYLLPRDKGPERRLVRDVVDSRRTVGTWFFGGALIVILGSSQAMPPVVRLAANGLWIALALAVIIDSFLITRKVKRLIGQHFPKSDVRPGSLYFYAIMRGITFRRMRVPKPQVKIGDRISVG